MKKSGKERSDRSRSRGRRFFMIISLFLFLTFIIIPATLHARNIRVLIVDKRFPEIPDERQRLR